MRDQRDVTAKPIEPSISQNAAFNGNNTYLFLTVTQARNAVLLHQGKSFIVKDHASFDIPAID